MSETVTDEDGVVLYPAGLVAQAEREAERLDSVSGVSALLRGLSRALATAQAEIRLLNETAAKPRAVTLADVWAAYEAGVHSGQHHPTADEALIRKAADAYVKSQFDYDPDTGALLRADTQRAEAAEARENELRRQLEETVLGATARVCDTPACRAAIIRRDDGARVCAAGHRARWVDIAELDAAEARERALHQRLADAEQRADYEARCVNQEKDHARALAAECARLREALEGAYRQIRDIVRGHHVECCITCAHPKSRSNVDGEEVVLGWPECINPSCVAHGDRVASASYGPALTPPARDGSIGMPTSCRKAFEQANRPTGGDDA